MNPNGFKFGSAYTPKDASINLLYLGNIFELIYFNDIPNSYL